MKRQVLFSVMVLSATMAMAQASSEAILQRLVDNMVAVEGGTFMMGASEEQGEDAFMNENPAHQVTVSSFSIGKYEVTQEEWNAVMGQNPAKALGAKRPVEQVSWNDCLEFISKLNELTGKTFRLPTEAEWEFAARGGNLSKGYKYAGSDNLSEVAWYREQAATPTHNVGQKKPNELGLYDMSGNVWEWCNDGYGAYDPAEQTDPKGREGSSSRVYRGGSWNYNARSCRVSTRSDSTPKQSNSYIGLRLAM